MRSQEDYDNVIKLHLAGKTQKEIASSLKINKKTIARMIKHHANSPDANSPGGKEWKSKLLGVKKKPDDEPQELGINWKEKLPIIQIQRSYHKEGEEAPIIRQGRGKPVEWVRCPKCGAKIVKDYPCVACYQKLVCFSEQDCYFNELVNRIDPLAYPVPYSPLSRKGQAHGESHVENT